MANTITITGTTASGGTGTSMSRLQLLTRIARTTGRHGGADVDTPAGYSTSFVNGVYEALDEALVLACKRIRFKEARQSFSLSITLNDYYLTLPGTASPSVPSAFQSVVYKLCPKPYLRDSGRTYPFAFISADRLEGYYPDRSRTGSSTRVPRYGALNGSYLNLDCRSNGSYTLYYRAYVLPKLDIFSNGSDATESPIIGLDQFLLNYACGVIIQNAGGSTEADRFFNIAGMALAGAKAASDDAPGEMLEMEMRGGLVDVTHPDPSLMAYDETTLSLGYPYEE